MEWYKAEIGKCTTREFTTGFYFGKPTEEMQIYQNSTYIKNYTYLGTAGQSDEKGRFLLEQKNKFSVGETIEVMKPDGRNLEVQVKGIWKFGGRTADECASCQTDGLDRSWHPSWNNMIFCAAGSRNR